MVLLKRDFYEYNLFSAKKQNQVVLYKKKVEFRQKLIEIGSKI